jgi:SAM-dependent methyltransferase
MAHKQHIEFFDTIKNKFPKYFRNTRVLDIGSLDINGCNRFFFVDCNYIGLDLGPGKNVDIISVAHEYMDPDESFDVVISSNCFEHDMYHDKTIRNAIRLLKSGGLLMFVCKTILPGGHEKFGEHGTVESDTFSSPFTSNIVGWSSYYKNLSYTNLYNILKPDEVFSRYEFSFNVTANDICFWGIKK